MRVEFAEAARAEAAEAQAHYAAAAAGLGEAFALVVYRVSGDLIRIVAVAHQRRRSDWQGR